jgi:hypothetical protein
MGWSVLKMRHPQRDLKPHWEMDVKRYNEEVKFSQAIRKILVLI